jgi:roadblock/LC7 domain-containing protein
MSLEKALSKLSLMEGVVAVEQTTDGMVLVYVDNVDARYAAVTALFAKHSPETHGQIRGPSFPVGPSFRGGLDSFLVN